MMGRRYLQAIDWNNLDPWKDFPLEKVQTTESKAFIQALRVIAEELHDLNVFFKEDEKNGTADDRET